MAEKNCLIRLKLKQKYSQYKGIGKAIVWCENYTDELDKLVDKKSI